MTAQPQTQIIGRMVGGVTGHFHTRAMEWLFAYFLFGLGVFFVLVPDAFQVQPAFAGIQQFTGQAVWGWLCCTIGFIRLLALIVNGTFAHKGMPYATISPYVRSLMAGLSCFFWMSISFSILAHGASSGLVIYPGILIAEFYNIARAARDAGRAAEDAKRAAHSA